MENYAQRREAWITAGIDAGIDIGTQRMADLMAAIERLCQIEERGKGVLIMPREERQVRITEALKRKWKERRSGNASQ